MNKLGEKSVNQREEDNHSKDIQNPIPFSNSIANPLIQVTLTSHLDYYNNRWTGFPVRNQCPPAVCCVPRNQSDSFKLSIWSRHSSAQTWEKSKLQRLTRPYGIWTPPSPPNHSDFISYSPFTHLCHRSLFDFLEHLICGIPLPQWLCTSCCPVCNSP